MPKETTYSDQPMFFRRDDGGEYPVEEYRQGEGVKPLLHRGVQVSWNRNGFVEIGTTAFVGETGSIHEPFSGCFLSLDRAGINRVIRTLRKARDQAFGSDA